MRRLLSALLAAALLVTLSAVDARDRRVPIVAAGGGGGPITRSTLTNSTANGAAPWTTASVAPTGNCLVVLSVAFDVFGGGTLGTVTVSGGGMTSWASVTSVDFGDIATPQSRLHQFRSMQASPGSGTVTISTSGGTSEKAAVWVVEQFCAVDTGGSNGSAAVVQAVTNRSDGSGDPNTLTVTLAALGDATNNVVYGVFSSAESATMTPGSGYTELTDQNDGAAQDVTVETQWKLPGTTTPNVGGISAFVDSGGIGIEIKVAP